MPGKWNPEPGDPPPKVVPPPRPQQDPNAATDLFKLSSDSAKILPIAYGTVRVPGLLIERYQTVLGSMNTPLVQPNNFYTSAGGNGIGFIVQSNGKLFIVTVEGQTGGGAPGGLLDGTGTDIVSGSAHFSYVAQGYQHFALVAFCEGQIFGFGKAWQDKLVLSDYTQIPHVATWIWPNIGTPAGIDLQTWFPRPPDGIKYANTACLMIVFQNGADQGLPDLSVEVKGLFADATHADANPYDIAKDLLTHVRRGLAWPTARVDSVSGDAGTPASWRNYCDAAGLRMSWLIDQQTSAKELLQQVLVATNTDPVWTNQPGGGGGMLKFVPRGDQPITANGVTYTPSFPVQYALTEADFLQPLQSPRIPPSESFNSFPIEFTRRDQDYRRDTVGPTEMADFDKRGLRRQQTTSLPMVIDPAAAVMLSSILAQRSINIRNTYTFKVGFRYCLLEPGDVVTLADLGLGMPATPVRILTKAEDQAKEGGFTFTAQDWPAAVGAAPLVTPQLGDGFKPNSASDIQNAPVLPANVPPQTIPDTSSTRGGSVDNLWPNPTSENPPPDGADTTAAEWAGRTYLGTNAYAGNYVRCPGLGANLAIPYDVPAAPGESFYMEAQAAAATPSGSSSGASHFAKGPNQLLRFRSAKAVLLAPTAGQGGFVRILALDGSGNTLASSSSAENDTAGFTKVLTNLVAPAGTVEVRFQLVNGSDPNARAYFDAIYCRRQVDANVIAQLGGFLIDEIQTATMKGIARVVSGSGFGTSVDKVWWRGNDDYQTRGGAPNIASLKILVKEVINGGSGFPRFCRAQFVLHMTTGTDNLDAMRFVVVDWYGQQNIGGVSATLVFVDNFIIPVADRRYQVPATDTDGNNDSLCDYLFQSNAFTAGFSAFRATVYNAFGPSDTNCFYSPVGWTAGAQLTNNGTSFPAWLTGGGTGGTGGGSNAGRGCLDPETPVMIAPYAMVPLHSLHAGDRVWTRPEGGGELGYHEIESVRHTTNLRQRTTLRDGRAFVSSVNHLVNVRGLWRRADWLSPGEEIQGDPGGFVRDVEYLGEGQVVQLSIPTARTYFAGDGVFHHNTLKP